MRRRLPRVARPLPVLCVALGAALGAAPLAAQSPAVPPNFDARAARPALPSVAARDDGELARLGVRVHRDERLGLPTFVWADPEATPPAAGAEAADPAQRARGHLQRLARLYGLDPAAIDALEAWDVQRLGRGSELVRFRQYADGLEVFRDGVTVLSDGSGRLRAVSGTLAATGRPARGPGGGALPQLGFRLDAREAIAIALNDHGLDGAAVAGGLQPQRQQGAYRWFAPATPSYIGDARKTRSLRTKSVWYRGAQGLEPAWYVESSVERDDGSESLLAHLVSGKSGAILLRQNLVQSENFAYRVWAQPGGDRRPLSGPQGNSFYPHPTGTPDGTQPAFVAPNLVSVENVRDASSDPWLPAGATESTGNAVDAYADLGGTDGFSPGDLRATTTAANTFDRTYDVASAPGANADQIQAAVVQMFYVINWLHDRFYDAGFTESAGNAQQDNYGRGGLDGDRMNAEGQDFGSRNNANMATPLDGGSPRMQMYIFDGFVSTSLQLNGGALNGNVQSADFGPQTFDVTGSVIDVDDGSTVVPPGGSGTGTIRDGCQPPVNNVVGRVVLIDRGACNFTVKVKNAQDAGASAVLIANNVAFGLPGMGGTDGSIVIASLGITQADGAALRTLLGQGAVSATLSRAGGVDRDGTIDNGIVAHEWGHYISNRLTGGLGNSQGGGMGEGWADFHALHMIVDEGMDPDGVYSAAGYAVGGPAPNNSYYYGLRRYPYSTDLTKNPLTFTHIQDSAPLPASPPPAFVFSNSEVHNTGEVWASMLWECYAGLLKDTPRLSFAEAERRMREYLVAGYKLTPANPTFVEARDALLAAILAESTEDFAICAAGFAKRGAGVGAVAPDRFADGNEGVTESFDAGGRYRLLEARVDDQPGACDFDGVLDGGETGTLTLRLDNEGFSAIGGGALTVSSATAGVSFPSGATVDLPPLGVLEDAEVTLPIAYASGGDVAAIAIDAAWSAPGQALPGAGSASLLANFDSLVAVSTSDDAESPDVAWTTTLTSTTDENKRWRRFAVGPTDHRYLGPDLSGIGLTALESPDLVVPVGGTLQVGFQHAYQFESDNLADWDGGVIEFSTNGGATWTDVATLVAPGYTGTITDMAGNPLALRPAFVGESAGYPALQPASLDFGTAFAGQTVRLRFVIGSDEAVGAEGWQIDDLVFTGIANTPFPTFLPHQGACAGVGLVAGANQTAVVGSPYAAALTARVTGTGGAPRPDIPVRFVMPSTGPSASFPGSALVVETLTDADGDAVAPAPLANGTSGLFAVAVEVGAQSVALGLGNVPAAPAAPNLTAASDSGGSAVDDVTNADPAVVTVACATGDTVIPVIDGVPAADGEPCTAGVATLSLALAEGAREVRARARKDTLTGADSPPLALTIDRSVAPPAILAATPAGALLRTVSGSAEPGAAVVVAVDGSAACDAVADGGGAWSCGVDLGGSGNFALTATQTDRAGNASAPSATFAVNAGEVLHADGFESP